MTLRDLYVARARNTAVMVGFLAIHLGYDLDGEDTDVRHRLRTEVDDAYQHWLESVELEVRPRAPRTAWQRLLRTRFALDEQILELQDDRLT